MRISVFLGLVLGLSVAAAEFPCEPSPATREALKRLDVKDLEGAKRIAAQSAVLDELLAAHPDDLFINLRLIDLDRKPPARKAVTERYQALAERQKDNPLFALLYAKALIGTDTPRALGMLREIAAANPKLAWTNMVLADVYGFGKFADRAALRTALEAYFSTCPTSLAGQPGSYAARYGSPELAQKVSAALRTRLASETDPDLLQRFENVWNLDFKAHPPAEHEQVRKQVAADLQRLESLQPKPDDRFLELLISGYKNAGDEAGVKRTEERLLSAYPTSSGARRVIRARHEKDHKYPGGDASVEAKTAYYRESVRFADEQLKANPGEFEYLVNRFLSLAELDSATNEQLTEAGDAVLTALQKGVNMWSTPPFAFQVAKAWVKKGIRLERVPELIEMGRADVLEHEHPVTDRDPEEMTRMMAEQNLHVKVEEAQILLDVAKKTNQPETARSAVSALAGTSTDKPYLQSSLWNVRAKFAEIEGRKLDALFLYRAAIDARPADFKKPKSDEIAASVDRLWKELGGSAAGRELWDKKAKTIEVAKEGRWEKMDKPLPPWQLSDLEGKSWKLVQLEGKTLLVNLWATWCGPCRMEHPHLQKLYESLKDRKDVQILTFNVDDEIGKVAPYMKENHFTFPVLLAKNYVDELIPLLSIPRNWVVDATGKWRWQQIGFGSEAQWQDDITAKIDSAKPDSAKPASAKRE